MTDRHTRRVTSTWRYAISPIPPRDRLAQTLRSGSRRFEMRPVLREDFLVHVVDSDQAIADGLVTLLGTYGIEVLSYADAGSFLDFWLVHRPGNCCLITEADPPGFSRVEFLRELLELRVDIPVLLLVSTASPDLIEAVRHSNRVGVIRKPCLDHTLVQRVLEFRAASPAHPGSQQTSRKH